jgi:two-component system chemotaxis response regulator CheB
VAGIVLSGTLDDGAAGLWAIRSCGGVAIVQEPSDALHAELPTTVLRTLEVDHCLPVREIAPLLVRLAGESVPKERCVDESAGVETRFTTMNASMEELNGLGKPSMFTCPSCHGALWELQESSLLRYRCHTGHAYSSDSLLAEQEEATEAALYSAMRALQERAAALRRIQEHFKPRPGVRAFDYEGKAQELDRTADVLRRLLVTPGRAKDPASGGNGGAKGQPSGGNGE